MPTKHSPTGAESDQRTKSILSTMKNQSKPVISRSLRQRVIDLLPNEPVTRLEVVVLRRYPRRLVDSAITPALWRQRVEEMKLGWLELSCGETK